MHRARNTGWGLADHVTGAALHNVRHEVALDTRIHTYGPNVPPKGGGNKVLTKLTPVIHDPGGRS